MSEGTGNEDVGVHEPNELGFMCNIDLATQKKYYAALRNLSPDQRMAIGLRLSREAREAHLALIREKFPDWSPHEVRREYLSAILTSEKFEVFYPGQTPVPIIQADLAPKYPFDRWLLDGNFNAFFTPNPSDKTERNA